MMVRQQTNRQILEGIDLRLDAEARVYVKDEVVDVVFATQAAELMSGEGLNRYVVGDALVTSVTGERWSVSRERFNAKYLPVAPTHAGQNGQYQATRVEVLAKQMHTPFAIQRRAGGDLLHGETGDWLMQYAPGDFGITKRARFERVYRLVSLL